MGERLLLLQFDIESAIDREIIQGLLREGDSFVEEITWTGAGAPRRPRNSEAPNRTTVDWNADRATLDVLTTKAVALMQQGGADRLVVVARMPLPLALHLGTRLFACTFRVDVINVPVTAHPASRCTVTQRDADTTTDLFDVQNMPATPSPAGGAVAVYVSTAPLSPTDQGPLQALVSHHIATAVELRVAPTESLIVTSANMPALARQLEGILLKANQYFPNARDLVVFLRGPIELGIALGRAINGNTWSSVRFAHFEAGAYSLPGVRERSAPVTASGRHTTILHLSDLHLTGSTNVATWAYPLLQSFREDRHPAKAGVHAVVITGDLTNRALPDEFSKAKEFILLLSKSLDVPLERIAVVPGNHDLSWDVPVYEWKWDREVGAMKPRPEGVALSGDGVKGMLWRNPTSYPTRFENYARFYDSTFGRTWSLAPDEQFTHAMSDSPSLSILGLNSAWEIDEVRPENASLQPDALTAALAAYRERQGTLGLFAWHHPVSEAMRSKGLLERLAAGGVRVVLHGHVHEDRQSAIYHLDPDRRLYGIGAGTLGTSADARPESTPALFNVLTFDASQKRCRLHVYARMRVHGTVTPYAKFRGDAPGTMTNSVDLPL